MFRVEINIYLHNGNDCALFGKRKDAIDVME